MLDSVWRGSWAQGEPHDWTLIATAPDGNAGSTNAVEYPMGYYEFEARSDYDNGDPMGWSDWSQSVDGNPALELDFLQAAGTNGCNAWVLVWPGPQISQPVGWCNAIPNIINTACFGPGTQIYLTSVFMLTITSKAAVPLRHLPD